MDEPLHDLTAAYALDALDAVDARAYEAHLAGCEHCQADLAELSATAGSLALAAEPIAPPAELRGRILAAARAERPNVILFQPRWQSRWAQAATAAAAAAVLAVVGLTAWNISLHNRLGSREALHDVSLAGAAGSVVVGSGGTGELIVAHLRPAPAGKTYEAWVIEGKAAKPAGVFTGGGGTTVVHLTRPVPPGSIVAVTVERVGGVDQPTSAPFITSSPV